MGNKLTARRSLPKKAMSTTTTQAPSGPANQVIPAPDFITSSTHFILNTPMAGPWPDEYERAIFATGCYWGAEKGFWKFPGVKSTAVGFIAGQKSNPTYQDVCTGQTGHAEGVHVVFDPKVVTYSDILRQFFQCHDPTQGNRQGADSGTQYRSGIYYLNDDQKTLAMAGVKAYEAALGRPITTEVVAAPEWYFAPEYHQQYLAKPGNRPYCSAMPTGVSLPPFEDWGPESLKAKFAPKLSEKFWKKHAPSPHCVLKQDDQPIEWNE